MASDQSPGIQIDFCRPTRLGFGRPFGATSSSSIESSRDEPPSARWNGIRGIADDPGA